MGVSERALAKVVVAIQRIEEVVELGSSRVERGIVHFVDPNAGCAVVEHEHLLPQYGVGYLGVVDESFSSRSIYLCGG